jgi:hypothetical protein
MKLPQGNKKMKNRTFSRCAGQKLALRWRSPLSAPGFAELGEFAEWFSWQTFIVI